jgi:hypothetical protein
MPIYNKEGIKDLGYANEWHITPDEVKKCMCYGHELSTETIGKCLTCYTCVICKYRYVVDSSD